MDKHTKSKSNISVERRAESLFEQEISKVRSETSRLFAYLMIFQWVVGVILAVFVSPTTWAGDKSYLHLHFKLAVILGLIINVLPISLAIYRPKEELTRHVIAISQMMWGSLLIHLSGGRIETHFHVFGSLAFLAFYRDWKVLLSATIFVALDHFIRGIYWPASVYGVVTASHWRTLEHSAWVVFENIFLTLSCIRMLEEKKAMTANQAQLEYRNLEIEQSIENEAFLRAELSNRMLENIQIRSALDQHGSVCFLDPKGKITYVNSKFHHLLGYAENEVLGKLYDNFIAQFEEDESADCFWQDLSQGKQWHGRLKLNGKLEKYVWVDGTIVPLFDAHGNLSQFVSISSDVSDLVEAEHKLRIQKDKLETTKEVIEKALKVAEMASIAKSEFLAAMSHEIRTPLNGISGSLDILANRSQEPHLRDFIEVGKKSCKSLRAIVDDVLDFSKIEAGMLELHVEPTDIRALVEEVIDIQAMQAQEKSLALISFVEINVPEIVSLDQTRVKQILLNLISNALKFTSEGFVSLEVMVERISDRLCSLTFAVQDSGIGIDSGRQQKIFDVFTQADSSTTKNYGGTGLGLSICKNLVRIMGGDIGVQSTLGEGSIFRFTIPVNFISEEKSPNRIFSLPETRIRILLVGKDNAYQNILSRQLGSLGINVMTACSLDRVRKVCQESAAVNELISGAIITSAGLTDIEEILKLLKSDPERDVPVGTRVDYVSLQDYRETLKCFGVKEITSPFQQSNLMDSVLELITGKPPDKKAPLRTMPSKLKVLNPKVLIAEDNEINRLIAREMFRDLGIDPLIVCNGKQAYESVLEQDFDLIFLDCHMPILDGFKAAEQIRKREKESSGRSVPIVALTADVTAEARDRCLSSGMDLYLMKPLEPHMLESTLAKVFPENSGVSSVDTDICEIEESIPDHEIIDMENLRHRYSNNDSLVEMVLKHFVTQLEKDVSELNFHCESRMAEELFQVAHGLKGAASAVGASDVRTAACNIETAAKNEDWESVERNLTLLQKVQLDTIRFISEYGLYGK